MKVTTKAFPLTIGAPRCPTRAGFRGRLLVMHGEQIARGQRNTAADTTRKAHHYKNLTSYTDKDIHKNIQTKTDITGITGANFHIHILIKGIKYTLYNILILNVHTFIRLLNSNVISNIMCSQKRLNVKLFETLTSCFCSVITLEHQPADRGQSHHSTQLQERSRGLRETKEGILIHCAVQQ